MNIKLLFMSMSICLSGTACSFGEAKQHSKDLSDKYSEDNSVAQTEKQKKNINAPSSDETHETSNKEYTSLLEIDPLSNNVNLEVTDDFFIRAMDYPSSQYSKKLLAKIYSEDPPSENATPIAVVTNSKPIKVIKVPTITDGQEEVRKVFSNNFDTYFVSGKSKKRLNVSFKNKEYIHISSNYSDYNISIISIESEGSALHFEDYGWSSCLYLYHKKSNKIMDFYPEGCVRQDIKRTGVTKKNDYERDEIYLGDVKLKNGVYTININNIPRLQNSQVDFSREKTLTYKFKLNLENNGSQFQLVDCDYRYKKSNKLIKEHRECDYFLN